MTQGTTCSRCTKPRRQHQRLCLDCHAADERARRARHALEVLRMRTRIEKLKPTRTQHGLLDRVHTFLQELA